MTSRAVLYLRLSQSDETSTSIARQEADLRRRAEAEGYTVTEVIADDGLSGGKDRPNADRALRLLREGHADVLMVWRFDRWSRQGLGALAALIDVLDARPDALFIADRDGLTSRQPSWRIIASVLAEVARMERESTQMRVRSSIAGLRHSHRYAGGNVPYGYRPADIPHGSGRVLVVAEDEAAIVGEVASRVLGGESLYAVMHDLNAREVPTRRGGAWSTQSLRQVLTSQTAVGRVIHHGQVLRGDDGLPVEVWPPVLPVETWHRVRAALGADTASSPRPRRPRRARLLSGLVTCASCGAPLYSKTNGNGQAAYACSARSNGRKCPGTVSVSADLLDDYVAEAFLREVGSIEVLERVEEAPEDARLADVERALQETAASLLDDDADVEALNARLRSLKERRAELRSRPPERRVRLVPTGETFAEAWERAALTERQAILSANVAVLAVSKGQRGRRGLDSSRVTLVTQPAHAEDAQAPDALRSPRPVV